MFCTHCGKDVAAEAGFCPNCGGRQPGNVTQRKLVRPLQGRKVAGVCLGLAHYLNVDPTLVRIVWLVLTFVPPTPGLIAYIIAWIVIPNEEVAPVTQTAPQATSPNL
jgi:phage shock protein C